LPFPELDADVNLMMCGGFQCSKNTLLGLNIIYVVVAFLLIGVASYGKSSAVITSLSLLGGIVASGVFLLFVAVLGLLATLKHHQVLLFVYMIILFGIFVIQFSVSCAALGINEDQEMKAIEKVWENSPDDVKYNAEEILSCCAWKRENQNATVCSKPGSNGTVPMSWCHFVGEDFDQCMPCESAIRTSVDSAFNGSGGLGLFFALTEILGAVLAYRYRNLANPQTPSASATLFS